MTAFKKFDAYAFLKREQRRVLVGASATDETESPQALAPGPKYQRLSRYDQTGLVWLLQGRRVVELTQDKAVIETATGTVSYRRYNKPALGPLGDSLDDFASGSHQ